MVASLLLFAVAVVPRTEDLCLKLRDMSESYLCETKN